MLNVKEQLAGSVYLHPGIPYQQYGDIRHQVVVTHADSNNISIYFRIV